MPLGRDFLFAPVGSPYQDPSQCSAYTPQGLGGVKRRAAGIG
ncbi:MAG: hypothetical protein SNJ68_01385 [Cyanobacteriota bacterium]